MKRRESVLKIILTCSMLLGIFCISDAAEIPAHPRKIVVFERTFVNEAAKITLLQKFGAVVIKPLHVINGLAVYLPPQAEKALLERAEVLRIDDDFVINATAKPAKPAKPPKPQPSETLPWGVDRINAELTWSVNTGLAIKVAILDTGIDIDHLDLWENIKGGYNAINPLKSANDDNGHGTHVAGIVAAVDNEIGVIGVGPQIYLYAVKVLARNGSGWLSDLIEGIDWCINNNMQVINMSLGASSDNQSFHDAITAAYNAGITQVAAAGNNGSSDGAVDYPARYVEVIAVSAIGQDDKLAYFSSYGPEVDLTAPGVNITSTYKDGYYKILNGTSMAAPHVSGTAALVLNTPVGSYDVNGNNIWDPTEVQTKLTKLENTEDLGLSTYEQGSGLVRADLVTQ